VCYTPGFELTAESGRFLPGANRATLPGKPTDEANRCNLRHVTLKALQKALYVGFSQISQPLQVVCLRWSQFPVPEARLAAVGETNLRSDPPAQNISCTAGPGAYDGPRLRRICSGKHRKAWLLDT
jgi:hypothetical protein